MGSTIVLLKGANAAGFRHPRKTQYFDKPPRLNIHRSIGEQKEKKERRVKGSFVRSSMGKYRGQEGKVSGQVGDEGERERPRISRQNRQNSEEGRGPGNSDGDEHGDIRDLPPRE